MPTQEPSSEIAAVLRREAEQLLHDLHDSRLYEAQIAKLEAFARRQRAQALREAANAIRSEHQHDYDAMQWATWLRARAAAEGTGGGE